MSFRQKTFFLSGLIHIAVFAFFLIETKPALKQPTKIVVKNYIPPPIQPKPLVPVEKKKSSKKPLKKPTPVKRKSTPFQQKKQQKIVKKKSIPNAKLLESLQDAFAQLETTPTFQQHTTNALAIPKHVQKHTIETTFTTFSIEKTSFETLIHYLESQLELPEQGTVTIEVTIDNKGKLLDFTVTSSASEKNAKYLKNRLPQLTFPCLSASDQTQNFTIHFKNL